MNSWKASLVISCCSPGKCLLGWAGKQERALTGVCVGTRAPGSALSRPCVAAPGEFKQSGTAWVRPLFVLFSSFRDVFQGVFWEGQLPSRSRVVHSRDTEHADILLSGLAFSVLWLVPPPEWEYCILSPSFSTHGLHAGTCAAPDQGVQNLSQKRMIF